MRGRGCHWIVRFALVAAAVVCGPLWAASPYAPGVDNVRFRNYSTGEGLSQATAMALAQDKTGFLWIGTQDGLDRFDGYGFRVFRHIRTEPWSLTDNSIFALAAANDGSLWIGTQAGGLDHYDPEQDRFAHYRAVPMRTDALASDRVTALLIDHRGWLWVGSAGGKLQWLDPVGNRFRDTPLGMRPELANVRALVEQADGSVLIGTRDGLWRCDNAASKIHELRFDPAQSLDVQALTLARNGDIWVTTADSGLYRLSAAGAALAHYFRGADAAHDLPDNEVRGLQFDAAGRLWIASKSSGLLRLVPDGGQVEDYRHDPANNQSVAADRQQSVMVDRDGLIWAGSWNNGISVHDPRTEAFHTIHRVPGDAHTLPVRPVSAITADKDGTLWMGMPEGGGLVHFDLRTGVMARYAPAPNVPGGLPAKLIETVLRARDGSLWLALANGGLAQLAPGATAFVLYRHVAGDPDSLASDDLLSMMQDQAGTLWIGSSDAGLDELCEHCTKFRHHQHDTANAASIGAGPVATVLKATDGALWIALRPGGLDRYDPAKDRFTHFNARADDPQSLSNNTVTALLQDRRGRLWVGTQGGGLNRLLPQKGGAAQFDMISTADGLAADAIGSIVEDGAHRLWLSTTAGISRYDPDTSQIVNFGPSEGTLPQGYYINSWAQLDDGHIVFGGLSGATLFDPAQVKLPPNPRPVFTEVLLNNLPVEPRWRDPHSPLGSMPSSGDGKVVLDYDQTNVSFAFSAFGFGDPESIQYAYLLQGHDREWIDTDATRRYATYTDLPSGDYHLRVRARRGGGAWNDNEATLALRVLPAPWLTPLAILGYCLALLLLILGIGWRTRVSWRVQALAQASIRDSEERLKFALWGSGGELWDVDLRNGKIVRENRLEHLAASHQTAVQTLDEYRAYLHPQDLRLFEQNLAAHLKGERDFLEVSYRTPDLDGQWRWLLTRGRVVQRNDSGRALRIVGTTQDISVLKLAEESLRKLNEELESRVEVRTAELRRTNVELRATLQQLTLAQRQLLESEKMAALGGLVAGVAHEINTPLGVTVTAASHLQEAANRITQLVQTNALTPTAADEFYVTAQASADIILRNLQRADRMIKSFKLIAVDQSTEERRTIDLSAYLGEILISLGPLLKKSQHQARIECAQALLLNTYPGALYQIVSNLVMNSLIHAFRPGQNGEIVISAQCSGKLVELRYRDNGCGMSEAVRTRVFEPFFTTRRGHGGSGLGLHVVYNLVTQLLKGSIRVESAPDQGTTFEIFMPLD